MKSRGSDKTGVGRLTSKRSEEVRQKQYEIDFKMKSKGLVFGVSLVFLVYRVRARYLLNGSLGRKLTSK